MVATGNLVTDCVTSAVITVNQRIWNGVCKLCRDIYNSDVVLLVWELLRCWVILCQELWFTAIVISAYSVDFWINSELKLLSVTVIFWDISPCNPLKGSWGFGGTYRLHFHGQSSVCHLLSGWFLAWLIILSWTWRRYVPLKRRLTFNGLHGVISQKIALFMITAVRTSKSYEKLLSFGMRSRDVHWIRGWVGPSVHLNAIEQRWMSAHAGIRSP
jgi:hypothetical protein